MLGNWSFGDYFKREAIHWAWEFLTDELEIDPSRLAATVYTDDDDAYAHLGDEIGLPPERIVRWGNIADGDDHNFWQMADDRPVRPMQRDALRPRRGAERGARVHARPLRDLPALARDLEPGLHAVRPSRRWHPDPAAVPERGHRDGPRADDVDRSRGWTATTGPICSCRSSTGWRRISVTTREVEAERFSYQVVADHSRAMTFLIGEGVAPLERRRRLRPAPDHAAGGPPRAPDGDRRAGAGRDLRGGHRSHGRRVSGPGRRTASTILAEVAAEEARFARTLESGSERLAAAGRRRPVRAGRSAATTRFDCTTRLASRST